MDTPQSRMVKPAMACVNRSSFLVGTRLSPNLDMSTITSMVPMVARAKTRVTSRRPAVLPEAAGYMSSGTRDSQGPKTKMMKSAQGENSLRPLT